MDFFHLLTICGMLLVLVVFRSLRREHIRVEHSVSWLFAAFLVVLLSRSQGYLREIARALGVAEPQLALVILVMIVFLGVFYRFSRVVSELKDMNITLTQRVAILEYELQRANEKTRV